MPVWRDSGMGCPVPRQDDLLAAVGLAEWPHYLQFKAASRRDICVGYLFSFSVYRSRGTSASQCSCISFSLIWASPCGLTYLTYLTDHWNELIWRSRQARPICVNWICKGKKKEGKKTKEWGFRLIKDPPLCFQRVWARGVSSLSGGAKSE